LAFIKSLSATYKARYNISNVRVTAQVAEYKNKKVIKYKKPKTLDESYKTLILKKRGEL
jgi:hypothetical protein